MFETRSQAWREVGLLRQISPRVVKRARLEALVLVPLFVAVVVFYDNRVSLLGAAGRHGHATEELEPALEAPVTIVTVVALVILGWAIARDIGRSLGPPLFRRLDPATAGTVGFLIRLLTVVLALLVALRVAGIQARTLALGGAFTARSRDSSKARSARSGCSTRRSPKAKTRSWCPTASCSTAPSSRCANPTRSTCARGFARG
jgi:hypothetical protein